MFILPLCFCAALKADESVQGQCQEKTINLISAMTRSGVLRNDWHMIYKRTSFTVTPTYSRKGEEDRDTKLNTLNMNGLNAVAK